MSSMGKSLQRAREQKIRNARQNYRYLVQAERERTAQQLDDAERLQDGQEKRKLKSIWETNDLDRFLEIADEREEGFNAQHNVQLIVGGKVFLAQKDKVVPLTDTRDWVKLSEELPVPKRPSWKYEMTADEIHAQEKREFLNWRRHLAQIEEKHKVIMTPYEKNLEVWRQLWRVVERADVVLEIVDARNPLVFRSRDFEEYVAGSTNAAGLPKRVVLLLNKADLLTEVQRGAWARYFSEKNVSFFFFSANPLVDHIDPPSTDRRRSADGESTEEEDEEAEEGEGSLHLEEDIHSDDESEDDPLVKKLVRTRPSKSRHRKKVLRAPVQVQHPFELVEQRRKMKEARNVAKTAPVKKAAPAPTADELERDARTQQLAMSSLSSSRVLSPLELLDCLALLRGSMGVTDADTPLTVGLVGYPNVGKSSTINAIMGAKRVVVSATPGKTKHFQTLVIPNERRVMLCDCPGLVFPSFASTREQMVCDGILPIDNVTDYTTPVAVVCRRIPRIVLEQKLNISLHPDDDVDDSSSLAERLLNTMARRRGYMTDHDKPNRSRSAKELLKMYVDGALVYVSPPPSFVADAESVKRILGPQAGSLAATAGEHAPPPPPPKGAKGKQEVIEMHFDDGDDDDFDEDQAWEDISSAEEARAISDDDDDDDDDDPYDNDGAVRPEALRFFARRRNPKQQQVAVESDELFNLEANAAIVADLAKADAGKKRRKKRTNHQIEPDLYTFINDDGEVELIVDDDDGVVELDTGHAVIRDRPKKRSKRAMRRDMKRAGISGPVNPTTRKVGVDGY